MVEEVAVVNKSKERFEVLLEEIKDKVQLVLEGHDVLRSEMKQMGTDLRSEMKQMENNLRFDMSKLDQKIGFVHDSLKKEINLSNDILSEQIKEVDSKLDRHIAQPAHG